jgi:hypothetical protein
MRDLLRISALTLIAVSLMAWLSLGPNLGWTKTSVTKWQQDPVTDLSGPVIEKRFVPGIDLLAACMVAAVVLFSISLLRSKTPNPKFPIDES